MKRNKIVAVVLVLMMMVGAVVLMSCGGCPGNGSCKYDPADEASFDGTGICYIAITDVDELKTAVNCAAYKALGSDAKGECDC
ncbi:MAG: hypothetical protein LBQ82_03145 [Treponema sp.]|nr:hypothetical protein [Treponema sp.]